jgi:hypothetical protein
MPFSSHLGCTRYEPDSDGDHGMKRVNFPAMKQLKAGSVWRRCEDSGQDTSFGAHSLCLTVTAAAPYVFTLTSARGADAGGYRQREARVIILYRSVSIRMTMHDHSLRYLKLIMCKLSGSTLSARCLPTGRSRRSSSAGSCLASIRPTAVSRPRASWLRRTRLRGQLPGER